MSKEIKGYSVQKEIPTPDNPVEIKTIVCNGIEYPVEYLTQTNVVVEGKKYIELQQENQQLKDRNKLLEKHYKQGEKNLGTQIDITLKYEKVLDEIREYIEELDDNTDDTICYDIDKNVRDDLLQILDKVKE